MEQSICYLSLEGERVLPVKTANGLPNQIKITFPVLPYTELRPNYQRSNFWYKRAEVTETAREEAYLTAKLLKPEKPIEDCTIEEVFTVPTRRKIDVEGLMAACKAWMDGIIDAEIIVDDDCWHVHGLSGRVIYKKGVMQTDIIITAF